MQHFYIKKDSTLNPLRVELVKDGRFDFWKTSHFDNALQNADITFTMKRENGDVKISEAPCKLSLAAAGTCDEHYAIEYDWKPRDVKETGTFYGEFKIHFNGDIKEEGEEYLNGDLIVPIYEPLAIQIK